MRRPDDRSTQSSWLFQLHFGSCSDIEHAAAAGKPGPAGPGKKSSGIYSISDTISDTMLDMMSDPTSVYPDIVPDIESIFENPISGSRYPISGSTVLVPDIG